MRRRTGATDDANNDNSARIKKAARLEGLAASVRPMAHRLPGGAIVSLVAAYLFGVARKPAPPLCCSAFRRSAASPGAAVVELDNSLPSASKRLSRSAIWPTLADTLAPFRAAASSSFGVLPVAALSPPSNEASACTRLDTLSRRPADGAGAGAAGVVAAAPLANQTSPISCVWPSLVSKLDTRPRVLPLLTVLPFTAFRFSWVIPSELRVCNSPASLTPSALLSTQTSSLPKAAS